MKLVKVQSQFISERPENKGEKVECWNFYIQLDNGVLIAIKPTFSKQDYRLLKLLAETYKKENA